MKESESQTGFDQISNAAVTRRTVALFYAAVTAITHGAFLAIWVPATTTYWSGTSWEGRLILGVAGAVYSLLPIFGFCMALVALPRIHRSTARPCFSAAALVAIFSVWPVVFLDRVPWGVYAVVHVLNSAFLFVGTVTVLLATGALVRAENPA